MAALFSFDIVSKIDLQEIDNAVIQAMKEVGQRYDFKGSISRIEFNRAERLLTLSSDDAYRLKALQQILEGRLAKRNVPLQALTIDPVQEAPGGTARLCMRLQQGIPKEKAREISAFIRQMGLKKIQTQIQDDQLRVSAAKKDDLQTVIQAVRQGEWGCHIQFDNYR